MEGTWPEQRRGPGATSTVAFTPIRAATGSFAVFAGNPRDLGEAGYIETELAASGTATSFAPDGELTGDGHWTVRPDDTADFTTRVLIRRPADPAAFNGTVVVEWFNVTVGMDTGAHFSVVGDEILRGGYAYVGVSAQQVGIVGGKAAIAMEGMDDPVGLLGTDPERYRSLHHPGDAFSYDIYTQIGRSLRGPDSPLADLAPARFIAAGQSQSAFRMVTYVNAVHPDAGVFDGFFIHSRGRAAARLGDGGDVSDALSGPPVHIRTDLATPVLIIEAEGDLVPSFNYAEARQPDDDHIRLWEMAGTAHADRYTVGAAMADLIPSPKPINAGPAHYLLASALRQLTRWVADGEAPPIAPRIEIADGRDASFATSTASHSAASARQSSMFRRRRCRAIPWATRSCSSCSGPPPCSSRPVCASCTATATPTSPRSTRPSTETIAAGWVLPEDRDETGGRGPGGHLHLIGTLSGGRELSGRRGPSRPSGRAARRGRGCGRWRGG